jgi:iron complex transport system ATP-binding protein
MIQPVPAPPAPAPSEAATHEAATHDAAAFDASAVRVTLGEATVLDGVDLAVQPGEWVTVIGPNGAGKTTLLRAAGGLLPFEGSISLFGTSIDHLHRRDRARLVAMVPQTPAVPPGMAVLDYVLLGRTPYIRPLGSESAADVGVVEDILRRLDLSRFAGRPLETLSGGERQRAFLARALAQGAGLLLLDEPTSALDIGHQQEVLDLVDELRADGGLTVLASMHDLSLAGEYADRLVLLVAGRVVARGTPREVLTEPILSEHYGARVRVMDAEHGPVVVPVRPVRPPAGPGRAAR